jgi:hypothetical protein
MVSYRGGDGKPGFHQTDELSSAIEHVEHLRNDEGVERAQIFKMEEVAFEFRPYFRVELGNGAAPAPSAAFAPPMPMPMPAVVAASDAKDEADDEQPHGTDESDDEADGLAAAWPLPDPDTETEPVGAGRRGLFGR